MLCAKCLRNTDDLVLLPVKQKDGALGSIHCHDCAVKSPYYCVKHDTPHIGFEGDNSTVCLICVEEEVQQRKKDAPELYERLKRELPTEVFEEIDEDAALAGEITKNSKAVCVLRFIIVKARRRGISVEEVADEIIREKSAYVILSPVV